MKIDKSRARAGMGGVGAAEVSGAEAPGEAGFSAVDGRWEAGHRVASFAQVSSRQTHGTYGTVTIPPQPQPNRVTAKVDGLQLSEVQAALADQRIPKIGVTADQNSITVDGLKLTVTATATGISVEGSAIGLTSAQVEAALGKARQLAAAKKIVSHIDRNPKIMADVVVLQKPDGSFAVKTVAKVTVDPKLESQGQNVLNQLEGGHQMPERVRAAVANRARRTQTVG